MAEKEYIEREVIRSKIQSVFQKHNVAFGGHNGGFAEKAAAAFDEIPAADVEPVRHVTNRAKYFGETLCPNCGIHLDETSRISEDENEDGDIIHYEFQPSFCANCGAKFDGKDK